MSILSDLSALEEDSLVEGENAPATEVTPEPLQSKIKHIFRTIAADMAGIQFGAEPVESVEFYLNTFLNDGWKLERVQHVRTERQPDTSAPIGEVMLYVLTRD